MFKRRNANYNKPEQTKNSINLFEEIGNIQTNNVEQSYAENDIDSVPQININSIKQKINQIAPKPQVQDEDQEYLQHLQTDKKLQALFNSLEVQQTKNPQTSIPNNQQNDHKNQFQGFRPLPKVKNPIKFILPAQKKLNLYSASVSTQPKNFAIPQKQQINDKKITEDKEMQNLFKQIAQQKKEQQEKQAILNHIKPTQVQQTKPTLKPNQFIIQDDDQYVQEIPKTQFVYNQPTINQNQLISVEVDYQGTLSPQVSDNEHNDILDDNFHQQDFQDQLIRKTLTRHNYMKLQETNNLKQTKLTHKKDKLLNTILKTSWQQIDAKISADINSKLLKRNQLHQEMKYLQDRLEERTQEIDRKKVVFKQLQNQHQKIKKVIYFICYFGDQLLAPNESIESFFEDLTPNIISKIQKLADKVGIEEFMEKKRTRDELRDKYRNGRKKIKGNQGENEQGGEGMVEEQEDEDDDGECYMDDDDNY